MKELFKVVSDTFVMAVKAQGFHWDYEGKDFSEKHAFFGQVYADLYEAVDGLAEIIRFEGEKVFGGCAKFADTSSVSEEVVPSEKMIESLAYANSVVLDSLSTAEKAVKPQYIKDALNLRIEAHKKLGWMLNAMI